MASDDQARLHPAARAAAAGGARQLVAAFVDRYNHERLHRAIGYVAPADTLAGREQAIFAERDRKLEAARECRARNRREAREGVAVA